MAKFAVTYPVVLSVYTQVEAESAEVAIDAALEQEWGLVFVDPLKPKLEKLTYPEIQDMSCHGTEGVAQGNVYYGCLRCAEVEELDD